MQQKIPVTYPVILQCPWEIKKKNPILSSIYYSKRNEFDVHRDVKSG